MATTTPNYGWDVPTSTDYVKDGATAIETLGDDIDATLYTALGFNYPGLRLIKKQTIGSAVASVNVTSAFSATYDNYKIMIVGGVASAATALSLRLGATATGYYSALPRVIYSSGTVSATTDNNQTTWLRAGNGSTNNLNMNAELQAPFLTKNTYIQSSFIEADTTGMAGPSTGWLNNSTSYTDFTIIPSGGVTLTGGTIYVYGYGAS